MLASRKVVNARASSSPRHAACGLARQRAIECMSESARGTSVPQSLHWEKHFLRWLSRRSADCGLPQFGHCTVR